MLTVDTSPPPTKSWTKVQSLTNFLQLKSTHLPTFPINHSNATATASQANTRNATHHHLSSQPKSDRLKIFIGTWNMKGRLIELEPFLNTLQPSGTNTPTGNSTSQSDSNKILVESTNASGVPPFLDSSSLHPYHLLAIGTQECERDISESLFYPSKEIWEKKLSDYLGEQYKLLRCETLAGVHLAVFAWKPVTSYVNNVHSAGIKTGWANMVGNKGAVGVSLDFGSQSLLFINCHLRAHQTKLAERNANIHRILHELQIKGGKAPPIQSNAISRIASLKKIARSSRSTKSSKSSKTPKSSKSSKSAKLKESSEKIEIANGQDSAAPISMKSSTKKKSTKSSETPTNNNRSTSKGKLNATPTPKSTPNGTQLNNKTSATNTTPSSSKKTSDSGISPGTPSSAIDDIQHSVMEQFDHCFIFGDTNYRLNLTSRQFVLDAIQKQDFQTLLKYDQLTLERQQRTTPLATFKEHPINFIPTYKFDTLETIPTTTESSSSLPVPSSSAATNGRSSSAPSSVPQTPLTATTASSSSSSSQSFVITPTDSLHSSGSISIRYDTSPKQRIPSWTDRILWHDKEQKQPTSNDNGTTPSTSLPASAPTMASIATTATAPKPKLNLKWISAFTRKNKTNGLDRGIVERPVDKSTICYHYNTVMDPRLMGASDHLPVIGIFGVWFDDWHSGTSIKRTRSIKSIKKKVPLWKKWI